MILGIETSVWAFLLNVVTLIGGVAYGHGRSKAIITHISARLSHLEKKLDGVPVEVRHLKEQMREIRQRQDKLDERIDAFSAPRPAKI